ncbi:MAG: hypothetical protein WAM14_08740 [Candidatus Nitrosopolaris sp.]
MTINIEHEKGRQVRGLAIASIGSCIKRINKLRNRNPMSGNGMKS